MAERGTEQEQRTLSDERAAGDAAAPVEVRVLATAEEVCEAVADELVELVRGRPEAVLGLATGSTMIGLYAALSARVRDGAVSLERVRTFNLDEYLGLPEASPMSFRAFMDEHLFGPCGIDVARVAFPVTPGAEDADVRAFEDAIHAAGGIDLQLLGLGGNGHIAFNEPGSLRDSRTRAVELAPRTRADAAAAFGGLDSVPTRAVTMGVGTILEARTIRMLALGAHKADVVSRMLAGVPGSELPAGFLAGHPDVRLLVDAAAASGPDGR